MKVYDVPAKYEYLCIKEVDSVTKIWGAYFTYWRWEWDDGHRYKTTDKVVLFSGTVGKKLRYKFGDAPYRVDGYYRKHLKDGYTRLTNCDIINTYPFVHDCVSKLLMWHVLRN